MRKYYAGLFLKVIKPLYYKLRNSPNNFITLQTFHTSQSSVQRTSASNRYNQPDHCPQLHINNAIDTPSNFPNAKRNSQPERPLNCRAQSNYPARLITIREANQTARPHSRSPCFQRALTKLLNPPPRAAANSRTPKYSARSRAFHGHYRATSRVLHCRWLFRLPGHDCEPLSPSPDKSIRRARST